MGIKVGGVELYAGPQALHAPDDLEKVIVEFIGGAHQSLCIAVQEIDSRHIAEAVVEAKRRRVTVKVILEADYLVEGTPRSNVWEAAGAHEENREICAAFLRAGIDVISDLNAAIFHQKFVIRDPRASTAALLTGSTNFTLTDTGKNTATKGVVGNNLNHVLVLHGKTAAGQYQQEFDRLRSGTFGDLHERVEPKPREFRLGGMRIKPLFAPRHGPEMEIMKQMLKGKHRIDFAMFTFAQSSGIDDAMSRLVDSGMKIRGVVDSGQGRQGWAVTKPLAERGVDIYTTRADSGVRKVHHKLMVIDEALTIVGSFNYTEPANILNDENIIVIGDLEETSEHAKDAQQAVAHFALTEIDRIIHEHGVEP